MTASMHCRNMRVAFSDELFFAQTEMLRYVGWTIW